MVIIKIQIKKQANRLLKKWFFRYKERI